MRNRPTLAATAIAALGALLAAAAEASPPDRFVEPPYETYVEASCPDSIAPEGVDETAKRSMRPPGGSRIARAPASLGPGLCGGRRPAIVRVRLSPASA
jgi:hypothetical protein